VLWQTGDTHKGLFSLDYFRGTRAVTAPAGEPLQKPFMPLPG
jgi:hypothetical protein